MKFKKSQFFLSTIISVFSFCLIFSFPAFSKLAVAPLSVKLEIQPGDTGSSNVSIHNTGTDEIEVDIRLLDWWRSPGGDLKFLEAGTRERSCADWVLYSPTSLTLEPGERKQISVEVDVPEGVNGDHWAMLLVSEKLPPAEGEEPVTMRVRMNYAIKILQQDPNSGTKEAKITDILLANSNPLKLSVTYKNTGTVHIQNTGKIEIRDLQGETVKKFEIDKFPTLPGEEHIIEVGENEAAESLEPGQYYAIATMDYGGDRLIQGGLPIEISEGKEEAS